MAGLGYRGDSEARRHLHLVPDPPVFTETTFTMTELMQLTEEDMDQLDALRSETEGTAIWWALWRYQREEVRTDVEETHDNES